MRHIKIFLNWWAISLGVGTVSTIVGFANLHTETGYSALTVTALIISIFVSIGIHEIGHTIAGFAVKFGFKVFAIGPFAISKDDPGYRFHFLIRLKSFLGFTLFVPPDDKNLRPRMSIYLLGGPLASLVFGILAMMIAMAIPASTSYETFLQNPAYCTLAICFPLTAVASYFVFLCNIVPESSGITDGSKLQKLAQGGPGSDRWLAIFRINLENLSGLRPLQWSEQSIKSLTAMQDRSTDAVRANYLAYYWALDSHKSAEAERFLRRMVECRYLAVPATRVTILLEAAFFEVYVNRDVAKSGEWRKQIGSFMRLIPPVVRWRYASALLFTTGKEDDARRTAVIALNVLHNLQDGIHQSEKSFFEGIIALCDLQPMAESS